MFVIALFLILTFYITGFHVTLGAEEPAAKYDRASVGGSVRGRERPALGHDGQRFVNGVDVNSLSGSEFVVANCPEFAGAIFTAY